MKKVYIKLYKILAGGTKKYLGFSTDYVFDGLKGHTYAESDTANPQTSYGRTKHDGENKIIESGISKFYIKAKKLSCRTIVRHLRAVRFFTTVRHDKLKAIFT
jgi:hypothetical protein